MVDVLIIGAGPVGLTMAAQCLRYNISFRIIEKRSGPSKESRALAIHARTLELLQFLGVAKTFTKKGLPIKKALIYVDGDLKINLDFTNLDSQYPYILSLEQSNTERILEKHLNKNGIKVERNKELISLSKSGTAIIKSRKRKEKVKPKYVIGCDGAHSTVTQLRICPSHVGLCLSLDHLPRHRRRTRALTRHRELSLLSDGYPSAFRFRSMRPNLRLHLLRRLRHLHLYLLR